jgi:hypothetical protein
VPFKLRTGCSEHAFCLIAVLISILARTLRAQTSGGKDTYPSTSVSSFALCGQSTNPSSLSSNVFAQDGSNPINSGAGASNQRNDWVHSWMRKVDEARASHLILSRSSVAPHVTLVEQYRYDMSWQQDPSGAVP